MQNLQQVAKEQGNDVMNFGSSSNVPSKGVNMMLNTRELARIQGEIFMAKTYPRDINIAASFIQSDCNNLKLAEQAVYQYARGGTTITGPSIRLAEVIARRLGNIRYGYEELETTKERTTIRCYAYDIETNSQAERVFSVPHIRYTKKGSYKLEDPRDIYETVANAASRRIRACILEIVPGDIVDLAMNACNNTLAKSIDTKNEDIRNRWLEAFKKYGVTKEMIEEKIQRRFDAITANQLVQLKQIYDSIRDGVGNPEDYFNFETKPIENKETVSKVKQNINIQKQKTQKSNNNKTNNTELGMKEKDNSKRFVVQGPGLNTNTFSPQGWAAEDYEDIDFGKQDSPEGPESFDDGFAF